MAEKSGSIQLTAEQRKLAEQWEKQQQKQQKEQEDAQKKVETMSTEAKAVAKFLLKTELKMRRTQMLVEKKVEDKVKRSVLNCEYVTGTNLHLQIMSHKKEVLKMCPTMQSHKSFNDLEKIEDSCQLVMGMIALGAMARVIPFRQQYPNPNDPAAKKPKVIEMVPKEH